MRAVTFGAIAFAEASECKQNKVVKTGVRSFECLVLSS